MKINKNYILIICLIFYGLFGSWLSINTGISHDEYHEQLNWEINLKAIKLFLVTLCFSENTLHLPGQPYQAYISCFQSF